jgi:cytochrome b subunit of formate dehydrogenase
MTTGRVDKSWAIQHHDLWYEELKRTEAGPSGPADQPPSEITGVAS